MEPNMCVWRPMQIPRVRVCVSMTIADHLRSAKVHFYQVGLGAHNTVTDRGWKLMTLRTIQLKLGHSKVRLDQRALVDCALAR